MKSFNQNKLFLTLGSLTAAELKRFQQYVDSPFFNHSKRLSQLLRVLIPFAPEYNQTRLTREFLFEQLFPGEDIKSQQLREQMSFLYRLLKGFLIHLELQSREYEQKLLLLTQLRKRQLGRSFATEANALAKGLDSSKIRDSDYHWTQYQLAYETSNLAAQQELRTYDASLAHAMQHLDTWYYIQKLRGSNEMMNRQHILQADEKIYGVEPILSALNLPDNPLTDIPAILIYKEIWFLMQEGKERNYTRLKELLSTYAESFHPSESRLIYKNAQNYCIRQINAGNTRFEHELFGLYQQQLSSGLILIGEQIAHTDFKNIVTVALRERQFDWVEAFLKRYRSKVSLLYRENVYNFCWASYLQATSQTQKAIRVLNTVEFSDAYYQLSAKHLLLRCYYEQKDWDALTFLLNSFQHFLARNKEISTKNRGNHLNFLKYFRKLLTIHERTAIMSPADSQLRLQKLSLALEQAKQTAHLGWLKEQTSQLLH